MSYLLSVPVGGGADVVVFEVDRSEVPEDLVLASAEPGKVADRARTTLEEALASVKPSLAKVVQVLWEIAPDEATVEFGLKMGGEIGMIIAKGAAEVNLKSPCPGSQVSQRSRSSRCHRPGGRGSSSGCCAPARRFRLVWGSWSGSGTSSPARTW